MGKSMAHKMESVYANGGASKSKKPATKKTKPVAKKPAKKAQY